MYTNLTKRDLKNIVRLCDTYQINGVHNIVNNIEQSKNQDIVNNDQADTLYKMRTLYGGSVNGEIDNIYGMYDEFVQGAGDRLESPVGGKRRGRSKRKRSKSPSPSGSPKEKRGLFRRRKRKSPPPAAPGQQPALAGVAAQYLQQQRAQQQYQPQQQQYRPQQQQYRPPSPPPPMPTYQRQPPYQQISLPVSSVSAQSPESEPIYQPVIAYQRQPIGPPTESIIEKDVTPPKKPGFFARLFGKKTPPPLQPPSPAIAEIQRLEKRQEWIAQNERFRLLEEEEKALSASERAKEFAELKRQEQEQLTKIVPSSAAGGERIFYPISYQLGYNI